MENIQASIIRDFGGKGHWVLVGFHVGKNISREEGLKIKNRYGMVNGYSMNHNFGYEGKVPLSIFEGGDMSILDSNGNLKHKIVFDEELYLKNYGEILA